MTWFCVDYSPHADHFFKLFKILKLIIPRTLTIFKEIAFLSSFVQHILCNFVRFAGWSI
jgi:hypothetical protein